MLVLLYWHTVMHGQQNIMHINIHMYIHIYIHTWIHKCVTQTIGCGISHNYTNIQNFYSVKNYKHFTKQYYRSLFTHKTFIYTVKGVVFKYFHKDTSNFAFSFLRIVRLSGKLLKILMLAYKMHFFENKISLKFDI
jgi:hypothetical protein